MVSIRRKILNKGNIVQEQLLNVLQKHEDALSDGTSSDVDVSEDISSLQEDIEEIQAALGDESTEGSILARIKALEDG